MMIHGIGIDAVDVRRFKAAMDRRGQGFLRRLFTEAELGYCMKKAHPERHLAARFAAKASVLKALGRVSGFKEIEISSSANGAPMVKALGLKGLRCSVSLAHDEAVAIAEAVVEKDE